MDPLNLLRDIVEENMDRLIVARLEQDLELVAGCDRHLEASLERVIRFLSDGLPRVSTEPSGSHDAGESYEI